MACTQKLEEVDAALAIRTLKPCKQLISYVGTIAILPLMTCTGVIDIDVP